MSRIPIPKGLEGSRNLPQTHKNLVNCFNNGNGMIIPRPGITQLNTTSSVARGQFEWNGSLYQVVSTDLIKITNTTTGDFSIIGTIAGAAPIETAVGFNHAVIVVRGGNLYTLDPSDTLVDITANTNFESCVDVCHINGRFIYIPTSGDPAFFSDVGAAGTVDVLSFFDAEELPDKNNACFNLSNTLYIMGTDSIELFRDTGESPNPFGRVSGALIRNGYIGGLLEHEITFYFIGRKKDQGAGIFAVGAGQAPKISNERIDDILSTYTNSELAEAIPGRLIWLGYDIATFTLERDSFGFFAGEWFKLDTLTNGQSRHWQAGYITEFEGEYFTAFDDKIGKFAEVNLDYSMPVTKIIGGGAQEDNMNYLTVQSMEVGFSQGYNPSGGTVGLRMSRNNVQFGPVVYLDLGAIGQYANRLKWKPYGGLGRYEGFFGYEIFTTEDVIFAANYITADIN